MIKRILFMFWNDARNLSRTSLGFVDIYVYQYFLGVGRQDNLLYCIVVNWYISQGFTPHHDLLDMHG